MRQLKAITVAFAITLLSAAALPARAQTGDASGGTPPPAAETAPVSTRIGGGTFGTAGQLVFSVSHPDEFPFLVSKTGDGDWRLVLQPSADYFLATNISVGGLLRFTSDGGGSNFGVGARGGYNLEFTPLLSLWLRAGIIFNRFSPDMGDGSSTTVFDFQAPLLFHLTRHFFVGVGPFVTLPLQGGGDATYGLRAIIGGYL